MLRAETINLVKEIEEMNRQRAIEMAIDKALEERDEVSFRKLVNK
ncbi:IDEAL domain-containing protein [Lysinibacillus halotolerans]